MSDFGEEMSMKLLALTAAMILASGCTAAVKSAEGVADADAAKVAHCTFVKDVSGRSVFGGSRGLSQEGIAKAKQAARDQAAAAGATDIVWEEISSPDVSMVSGKAYRCPKG
jgi:hypothetical protein